MLSVCLFCAQYFHFMHRLLYKFILPKTVNFSCRIDYPELISEPLVTLLRHLLQLKYTVQNNCTVQKVRSFCMYTFGKFVLFFFESVVPSKNRVYYRSFTKAYRIHILRLIKHKLRCLSSQCYYGLQGN